jgi:hypothetical protein
MAVKQITAAPIILPPPPRHSGEGEEPEISKVRAARSRK